jgi:hypothetical protein
LLLKQSQLARNPSEFFKRSRFMQLKVLALVALASIAVSSCSKGTDIYLDNKNDSPPAPQTDAPPAHSQTQTHPDATPEASPTPSAQADETAPLPRHSHQPRKRSHASTHSDDGAATPQAPVQKPKTLPPPKHADMAFFCDSFGMVNVFNDKTGIEDYAPSINVFENVNGKSVELREFIHAVPLSATLESATFLVAASHQFENRGVYLVTADRVSRKGQAVRLSDGVSVDQRLLAVTKSYGIEAITYGGSLEQGALIIPHGQSYEMINAETLQVISTIKLNPDSNFNPRFEGEDVVFDTVDLTHNLVRTVRASGRNGSLAMGAARTVGTFGMFRGVDRANGEGQLLTSSGQQLAYPEEIKTAVGGIELPLLRGAWERNGRVFAALPTHFGRGVYQYRDGQWERITSTSCQNGILAIAEGK